MPDSSSLELIVRDLKEINGFGPFGQILAVSVVVLPLLCLGLLLTHRRRVAIAPLIVCIVGGFDWYGYYASGANRGLYQVGVIAVFVGTGWLLLFVGVVAPWRWPLLRELLSIERIRHPNPEQIVDLRRPKPR